MTIKLVYLNGDILPAAEASISVQDRGFRYGDGVFETIRIHGGKPYRLPQHLARLGEGLAALRIPADIHNLTSHCHALLQKNQVADGMLRLIITRGNAGTGYLPKAAEPTIYIETQNLPPAPAEPFHLWLSQSEKIAPRALPVHLKLCQGANSILARLEAEDHRCQEALLLNAAGEICEGSASNIFWLQGGRLHTPALDCGVLAGIIRAALFDLSSYPITEGHYRLEDLLQAEAVVMTNSVWEVIPVAKLQPQGIAWDSRALAETLSQALQADRNSPIS